jgi:uncharacterized protein YbcI
VEEAGAPEQTVSGGELASAISNAVVRIYTAHRDRGPTRAKTYLFDDAVLTVMEGSSTQVERTLSEAGDQELVHDIRKGVQSAISEELKRAIEGITGRRVRAFMSGSQLEPDVRCDVFLFEPENPEPDR